jgi:hypothetical protein
VFSLSKSIAGQDGAPGGGTDNVIGSLSRTTWPILCDQTNTPLSGAFDGAKGYFRVFEGNTDVTSSATFSVVATGCTGTVNTDVNTPVSGEVRGYYQVTAMSADAGTLELSATYAGRTTYATFTVTKAKVGYEVAASLPSSGNYEGRVVFLTTDGKLYRYHSGAWVAAVPATDVTGQLTDSQIADLAANKLIGSIVAAQIASITAPQITGTLTNAQIADLAATKITGLLSAAQIASIAAAQITGTLTNSQIADLAAAKLTGTISTTQIADGAISTPKLAAGSVTAASIAANTITAGNLAAESVTSAA